MTTNVETQQAQAVALPKKGSALTNFRNAFKESLNADKKLANQKAASEKKDKISKKK